MISGPLDPPLPMFESQLSYSTKRRVPWSVLIKVLQQVLCVCSELIRQLAFISVGNVLA